MSSHSVSPADDASSSPAASETTVLSESQLQAKHTDWFVPLKLPYEEFETVEILSTDRTLPVEMLPKGEVATASGSLSGPLREIQSAQAAFSSPFCEILSVGSRPYILVR